MTGIKLMTIFKKESLLEKKHSETLFGKCKFNCQPDFLAKTIGQMCIISKHIKKQI